MFVYPGLGASRRCRPYATAQFSWRRTPVTKAYMSRVMQPGPLGTRRTASTGTSAETQATKLRSRLHGASSSTRSRSQPLSASGRKAARSTRQRLRASSVKTRSIALSAAGSSSTSNARGLSGRGRTTWADSWDVLATELPFVPGSGRGGSPTSPAPRNRSDPHAHRAVGLRW